MNKFLKSALVVAGVAGAFGAAEANAVSFTVVVDKIELVGDADNYPNTAVTVYEPRSGVGEAATKTTNLFDATQKLGVSYTLRKPGAGTWESVVISFSEIKAVSGASEVDLLAAYTTAGTLATNGAYGVMVLGDDGDGTADSLQGTFAAAVAPIQTIITDGADFTLPALDWFLPESAVVANGSSIAISQLPRPTLAVSQATDSASRANVLVQVDSDTAFTGEAGWTLGASTVTVGLFDSTVPETPLVATTFTAPSPAAVSEIELIDVPNSKDTDKNIYPLAWIDGDSDGRLDTGEAFTFAEATRATNGLTVSGTADISASNFIGVTNGGADGILDTVAIDFPGRTISLTVEATNVASATATDCATANARDADTGLIAPAAGLTGIAAATHTFCGATTASSVTVTWATDAANTAALRQSVQLLTNFAPGTDVVGAANQLEAAEGADVVLHNTSQFDTLGNVSYLLDGATSGRILITGIPAFDTDFAADLNGSAYDVIFGLQWTSDIPATEAGTVALDEGGQAVGASVGNTAVVESGATAQTFATFD
jgi:hypothetical protein